MTCRALQTFVAATLVSAAFLFDAGAARAQSAPQLLWFFPTPGVPGEPAVGPGGIVYLPVGALNRDSEGFLFAINPDGSERWRVRLEILPSRSRPGIGPDGTIYVHGSGTEGNIVAIDRLQAVGPDGRLKWTFLTNGNLGSVTTLTPSSPAVAPDGSIYVGASNTFFFKISDSGSRIWFRNPNVSSLDSSPALGPDGTVYLKEPGNRLVAYAADGTLRWKVLLGPEGYSSTPQSPIVGSDGTIYVPSGGDGRLYAVSPAGAIRWSAGSTYGFSPDAIRAALGSTGDVVFAQQGTLRSVDAATGAARWNYAAFGQSWVAPVVGPEGDIYWNTGFDIVGVSPGGAVRWRLPNLGFSVRVPVAATEGRVYVPRWAFVTGDPQGLSGYAVRPTVNLPPNPPTGLAATTAGTTLSLTWAAPASGGVPTSYRIEAGSGPSLSNIANFNTGSTATSFQTSQAPAGRYYFRVRAENAAGQSNPSNEVTVVVGGGGCMVAPGAPGPPAATTNSGGIVVLSWAAPAGTIDGYILEAGSTPGASNIANVQLPASAPGISASGVSPGTYFVRVRARNACGIGATSSELVLVVNP